MKYLFLFLLVFTSGAAVATEPGSQYQQQAEAGDRRAILPCRYLVSSGDYQSRIRAQKAAAQGDGDALALAQLKIRNPNRRTIRRPASWRKKPSRPAVNPERSSSRGCWSTVGWRHRRSARHHAAAGCCPDSESDAAVDAQMLLADLRQRRTRPGG